jgi:hypothetical protein
MQTTPGRPRRRTRLARALGLDGNPLRRASHRAEAWIRIGLLAVFLTTGPMAAFAAGGWAYHAGIAATLAQTAPAHRVSAASWPADRVSAASFPAVRTPSWAGLTDQARSGADVRWEEPAASPRSSEMVAAVLTVVLLALTLLAALRITLAVVGRLRMAAWETAWSRVGPQWTGGRAS